MAAINFNMGLRQDSGIGSLAALQNMNDASRRQAMLDMQRQEQLDRQNTLSDIYINKAQTEQRNLADLRNLQTSLRDGQERSEYVTAPTAQDAFIPDERMKAEKLQNFLIERNMFDELKALGQATDLTDRIDERKRKATGQIQAIGMIAYINEKNRTGDEFAASEAGKRAVMSQARSLGINPEDVADLNFQGNVAYEKTPDGGFDMTVWDPATGGLKVKHLAPQKADPMDLLVKRDELQTARDERNRAAADARLEKTLSAKGNKPDPTDAIITREAVKDLTKLRKEAHMAAASKSRLDQMISLFDKGSAGGLKGNVLTAVGTLFDTPATSEADLFKKLASAGAGQLRSTVIGPGQVSNYEQKLLQSVSGGGNGARTAVRELLLFYKQEADRTIGNYDDAVDAAATVAPKVSKAFRKIGGKADPLGIR